MNYKPRYRIVQDNYCGYESQFRPWWSPLWWQCFGINTRASLEAARRVCDRHYKNYYRKTVEYYDPLT